MSAATSGVPFPGHDGLDDLRHHPGAADVWAAIPSARTLFDRASPGMALIDLDGRLLAVNPASCRLLGRDESTLLGLSFRDLRHPDEVATAALDYAALFAGHAHEIRRPTRYLLPGGDTASAEITLTLLRDAADRPIAFLSQARDVTLELAALEALEEGRRQLEEAQQVGRLGSWQQDLATGVVTWSHQLHAIYGLSEEEVAGDPTAYERLIHPEDLDQARFSYRPLLRHGRPVDFVQRVLRDDGQALVVRVRGVRLPKAGERPARLVGTVQDITESARALDALTASERRYRELSEELTHAALHDHLTGLPNRSLLVDRMRGALYRAQRAGDQVAVLFVDLDDFKKVNDGLGHDAGDELLCEVANRLTRTLRAVDTAARFGGDEFVVLCEGIGDEGQARELAERVSEAIAEPVPLRGYPVVVTASVGVVLAGPGEDPETLLRYADAAMYRAKRDGRARHALADPTVLTAANRQLHLEAGLRHALATDDGLLVHYQPVVDQNGAVVGAEALVRWMHPTEGLLQPVEFLSVAEASGLVVPLGERVLLTACADVAAMIPRTKDRDFTLAVNVAARQLAQPGFADGVMAVLQETGLSPDRLCLEITETEMVDLGGVAMRELAAVRALGVRLAVDDFGTGYAPLTYLKRLAADVVKLDRSFVAGLGTDVEDTAVVRAVITLALSTDRVVVAEGVETLRQLEILQALGCRLGQGFFLHRPMPAHQLAELLQA